MHSNIATSTQQIQVEEDDDTSSTNNTDNKENFIYITINDNAFSAILYDNDATQAFISRLPLTMNMADMNRNEKFYYLSYIFPMVQEQPEKIQTGDIMLYGSNCIVLFYETFSSTYSYTKLGYIENINELKYALGTGNVSITFSLQTSINQE